MRSWLVDRLGMLVATYYAAALARAITALPHDELTWQVEPSLGLAARFPSGDTETQILWAQDLCNSATTVDKQKQVTHTDDDHVSQKVIAQTISAFGADRRQPQRHVRQPRADPDAAEDHLGELFVRPQWGVVVDVAVEKES